MKSHRFQYQYRKSASKLHKLVGRILRTSQLFNGYQIYQEYPVSKINSSCKNNKLHYDWIILDLHLIIECMGRQHIKATDFSGQLTEEEKQEKFLQQQKRDKYKKEIALKSGYTYINIPYTDEKLINEDYIWNAYKENYNIQPTSKITKKEKWLWQNKEALNSIKRGLIDSRKQHYQQYKQSEQYKKQLAKTKEIRHNQYVKFKEKLNERIRSKKFN